MWACGLLFVILVKTLGFFFSVEGKDKLGQWLMGGFVPLTICWPHAFWSAVLRASCEPRNHEHYLFPEAVSTCTTSGQMHVPHAV